MVDLINILWNLNNDHIKKEKYIVRHLKNFNVLAHSFNKILLFRENASTKQTSNETLRYKESIFPLKNKRKIYNAVKCHSLHITVILFRPLRIFSLKQIYHN